MKGSEIVAGGTYIAKVSNKLTRVKVEMIDAIRGRARYHVLNLTTGRRTMFRSAAKFRRAVAPNS